MYRKFFFAALGIAFMATMGLASSNISAKGDKITVCPGSGSNCLSAETSDGTTIQLYKGQGKPDIIM